MKISFKWFIFILIFFGIFFVREIFTGHVYYCCDNLLINIPSQMFLAKSLQTGEFPLWNPWQLAGVPHLADINLSVFSPTNLLFIFLPPFRALTWSLLVWYLVALLGGWFLGWTLRLSGFAATVVAVMYGFSGSLVTYGNNLPILQVASTIPWVLGGWVRYARAPDRINYLVIVILAGCQIFLGHPQLTFYTWIVGSLYFFVFSRHELGYKLWLFAKVAGLVGLLTALQTLPFLQLALSSTRVAGGQFENMPLPLWSFLRLAFPGMVGSWSRGTAWAQNGSVHGYVNLIAWILAWLTLKTNRLESRFFGLLAGGSLLLAFSGDLVGFGLLREPSQWLTFFTLALSVLAGLGVELVIPHRVVLTISGTYLGIGLFLGGWGKDLAYLLTESALMPSKLINKLTLLGASSVPVIVHEMFRLTTFVGLLYLLLLLVITQKISSRVFQIVFLIVIFVELLVVTESHMLTVPESLVEYWFGSGQSMSKTISGYDRREERVLTDPQVYWAPREKRLGIAGEHDEAIWQWLILRPELPQLLGLATADGYAAMIYAPYQAYYRQPARDPTGVNLGLLTDNPRLDLVGVRYIIGSSAAGYVQAHPGWRLVRKWGLLGLYENPQARPRVFFSAASQSVDQTEQIRIDRYTPNRVDLMINRDSPGKLVFTDVAYPGWKAFVDSTEVPIIKFEQIFKSVLVPAGIHKVSFRFLPELVYVGVFLSVSGLLLLIWEVRARLTAFVGSRSVVFGCFYVLILALTAYSAYGKVLSFDFWKDDWIHIWNSLYSWENLFHNFMHPATNIQFFVFSHLFGLQPVWWQLMGVGLRWLAAGGVAIMMLALTRQPFPAALAGIFYASGAAGIDAVSWPSAQVGNLSVLLLTSATSFWINFLEFPQSNRLNKFLFLLFAGVIVDPWRALPVFVLLWWLISIYAQSGLRKKIDDIMKVIYLALAASLPVLFVWTRETILEVGVVRYLMQNWHSPMLIAKKAYVLGNYLNSLWNMWVGWLIPVWEEAGTALYSRESGRLAAGVVVAILLMCVWYRRNKGRSLGLVCFWGLWMLLFYVPNWLFETRLTMGVTHRYLVIPSVGFYALLAWLFSQIRWRQIALVLAWIFVFSNLLQAQRLLEVASGYREKSVVASMQNTINETTDRNERLKLFMYLGDDPVKTYVLSHAYSVPYALSRRIKSLANFPLVLDDPQKILPYICRDQTSRVLAGINFPVAKRVPLSQVYAWEAKNAGVAIDVSVRERQKLAGYARERGCAPDEY